MIDNIGWIKLEPLEEKKRFELIEVLIVFTSANPPDICSGHPAEEAKQVAKDSWSRRA